MSRSLDIAKILRATEIDNTTNSPLITDPNQLGGGMDSSAVQSVPMQYYETLDSLPITNLSIGLQAFVEENRKHYVSNGSGWYNTGYEIGAAPYWDSEPLSTYEITDSATPLVITALALDSDNPNLVNQSFGSDSAQYMATITNDSSVFTFTPKTKEQIATAIAAGNLTDSDGDFTYTFKWSDGINFVAKAANIIYNTSSGTNSAVAYRGFTQGVFGTFGTSTASETLAMPSGTQEGDQAILVIGGMGWTATSASAAISFPNNEFTLTQDYQWGYASGQYDYRTNRYTCSQVTSAMISNGVVVNCDDPAPNSTDYKVMTLITIGGGNTPLFNHAQINYTGSYSTGSTYNTVSAARPSGYATKNGIMEVLTTRFGTRTFTNYGNSQLQGTVNRSIYYIQAFYKNSSSGLLDQPGHRWTYNSGTIYSASSLVIAY